MTRGCLDDKRLPEWLKPDRGGGNGPGWGAQFTKNQRQASRTAWDMAASRG